MKTPCGAPSSEFYYRMRDMYTSNIDAFLKTQIVHENSSSPSEIAKKYLPEDIVITPSDKNLGVCLTPIAWYKMQYDVQCEKGQHEEADMSEGQCIQLLNSKVQLLRSKCI